MTDLDLAPAREWGEYLAKLPTDAAREEAIRAARQARMLATPEEELDKIGQPPIRTLGEFLDWEFPQVPMLVEPGIVARGGLTALVSKGGKGKTTLSFNRLIRWAMGKPLFDKLPEVMAPTKEIKSLIIENEGAGWHTQGMLNTMMDNSNFAAEDIEKARQNIHIWGDGGWSSLRMDDAENVAMVKRGCDQVEPDIVFLEPFRLLWRGEENSSTEMVNVIEGLFDVATTYNCGIMVSHHESKGGVEDGGDAMEKARGSTVFTDLGAVMERWAPVANDRLREWKLTKWRYAPAPAPVRMEYVPARKGFDLVEEDAAVRSIIEVLAQTPGRWIDTHTLKDEVGETMAKVRTDANKAYKEGLVKKQQAPGGGRMEYMLASSPDEDDNGALELP